MLLLMRMLLPSLMLLPLILLILSDSIDDFLDPDRSLLLLSSRFFFSLISPFTVFFLFSPLSLFSRFVENFFDTDGSDGTVNDNLVVEKFVEEEKVFDFDKEDEDVVVDCDNVNEGGEGFRVRFGIGVVGVEDGVGAVNE